MAESIPYHADRTAGANAPELHRVKLLAGNQLPFRPEGTYTCYGVCITLTTADEATELKYEAGVKWIKRNTEGLHIFELQRLSKVFVNDTEANDIATEMAELASKIVYPLWIKVDDAGMYQGIANYEALVQRVPAVKKAILDQYQGPTAEDFVSLCEAAVSSEFLAEQSLQGDCLIHTLFGGWHTGFDADFTRNAAITFPVLHDTEALRYQAVSQLEPCLDEFNLVQLTVKGHLEDDRAKADLEEGFNLPYYGLLYPGAAKAMGEVYVKCFLNPMKFTVETMYAEFSVALEQPRKVSVSISNLQDSGKLYYRSGASVLLEDDEL